MNRYRRVEPVEAIRFTDLNIPEVVAWIYSSDIYDALSISLTTRMGDLPELEIVTAEGTLTAYPGDWLINDGGELTVCPHERFEQHYELVVEETE
jgi:hypothetical protein